MTTPVHDCSPDLTAQRVQILRDYFARTTDIGRPFLAHGRANCMCSMEHVNFALDSASFPIGFDAGGQQTYEAHLFPHGQVPGLASMTRIIVAFNDATPVEVLRSDAWRLGLLPHLPEADSSASAEHERLQVIHDWLAKHGFTSKGPERMAEGLLYDVINIDVVDRRASILEALDISAEDYIGFLHTLINPPVSREHTTPSLNC